MKSVISKIRASSFSPSPHFCKHQNHYEFVKTDHEGKSIAGVKFTREGERSCVLCEFVSSEDGVVHVTGQMPVAYVIREIERWKASQEPTN